jgi:hypothetical protein
MPYSSSKNLETCDTGMTVTQSTPVEGWLSRGKNPGLPHPIGVARDSVEAVVDDTCLRFF